MDYFKTRNQTMIELEDSNAQIFLFSGNEKVSGISNSIFCNFAIDLKLKFMTTVNISVNDSTKIGASL